MFVTDCHVCGLRELRGARAIELLVNAEHGVEAVYRCTRCDAVNVLHPYATAPTAPTAPAPAPAPVAA